MKGENVAESETVDGEVTEESTDLVPATPRDPQVIPAGTLFQTNDPAEVVRKASEVAAVLTDILRKRELISKIGNREHVKVEGWTLCGSMLGVFAIPVWTRKLEDVEGWEARVEARTLSGAVVGAADAQCTREENMWSHNPVGRGGRKLEKRDDYALRSMAQTRAASKALRLPLGFIIELAGFDATPAEEIPAEPEPQAHRQEGPPPYPVPQSWPEIEKAVRYGDNPEEAWALFQAFIRAASNFLYGKTDSADLEHDQRTVIAQKAAGAVVWLHENVKPEMGELIFFDEAAQRKAWAAMLDCSGDKLPIPDYVAPQVQQEADEIDEEAARLAREAMAGADESPYS